MIAQAFKPCVMYLVMLHEGGMQVVHQLESICQALQQGLWLGEHKCHTLTR